MTTDRFPGSAVAVPVIMLVLAIGAGWWRAGVMASAGVRVAPPAWEHVKKRFPMPEAGTEVPNLSPDTFNAFVEANPFSSLRRYVPPPTAEPAQGAQPAKPKKSVLKFKGRIQLGKRQRAVVEEVNTKKTHFLEVGQAVAGYKVLDISEERVLLSDPQADEEVALFLTSEDR